MSNSLFGQGTINDYASCLVQKNQNQRGYHFTRYHPAHEIGSLVAEKGRFEHLDSVNALGTQRSLHLPAKHFSRKGRILMEILEGSVKVEVIDKTTPNAPANSAPAFDPVR